MNALVIILLLLCILALVTFIVISIIFIKNYINVEPESETECPINYFIEDLDGDNLINIDSIEQVNKRWNAETKHYEIILYLKSDNEIKEEFNDTENCNLRFETIKLMLNDSYSY